MVINNAEGEKVFISWSGGKDSYLAMLKAQEKGLVPFSLLSFIGADGQSSSHGLHATVLGAQAACLQLPIETEVVTWSGYEDGFFQAVERLKEQGAEGGVFGDINLQEHRVWVEKMAERCKIDFNLPLWMQDELAVSEELIERGGKALIVSIRNDLIEESWLGRFLDREFIDYCLSRGLSPCGEGGEAHTLVVDGPQFLSPLQYELGQIQRRNRNSLLTVTLIK